MRHIKLLGTTMILVENDNAGLNNKFVNARMIEFPPAGEAGFNARIK